MSAINNIWIFAETDGGIICNSYYEILSKVDSLYHGGGGRPCITAVILSDKEKECTDQLCASGADHVIEVVHEKLSDYHPEYYTAALSDLIQKRKPDVFFTPASPVGSEVAPGIAVLLDTGLIAHCTDLFLNEEGKLVALIPAFGGKLLGEISIPDKKPVMASVTPGVFRRGSVSPKEGVRAEMYRPDVLDGLVSRIELVGKVVPETQEAPLESADAVVCVGLGIRNKENWDKALKLSEKLNAAFGYTRPVVDMGYADSEKAMVGSSGKVVRPKLYIGFGISGAAQHVCGMKDSGVVISVNTDEQADIFDVSDYKVVGDSGKILDALLQLMENPA